MKKLTILLLTLLFLIINGIIYSMTTINGNERIKLVLNDNLQTLQTHYDILIETQKNTAQALYIATINSQEVLKILSDAKDATKDEQLLLREKLQKRLEPIYRVGKIKGVLQYQFVFPDNTSFLRMHKPSKFGDNLTDVRDDFRYVNKTLKPTRGFVQGRVAHGFRNTFPLFDKNNKHIGAMEISFSSDRFQLFLNEISHIHTHFLVNKKVFDVKFWKRDDSFLQYSQSAESPEYMISLGTELHSKDECITQSSKRFSLIRDEVTKNISKGEKFSLYMEHDSHADIVSFLPIKNLDKSKTLAWLVSYEESRFVQVTLRNIFIIRLVTLLFTLVLIYFIAQLIRSKTKLANSNVKLKDIALYDPLTGLRNRFYLERDIENVILHHKEHNAPYATLMFDIDWFKEVNDTYGHDIGDEVLKELSQILQSSVREEDKVYRAGGEEFVILLNRITYKQTKNIAEKIRLLIQNHTFKVKNEEFSKTISAGLYHSSLIHVDDVKTVLKLIDNALYESKTNGRNRVTNCSKRIEVANEDVTIPTIQVIFSDITLSTLLSKTMNGKNCEEFPFKLHPDDLYLFDSLEVGATQDNPYSTTLRVFDCDENIVIYRANIYYKDSTLVIDLQDSELIAKSVSDATLVQNLQSMLEHTDDYIYFKDKNHVFTAASKTLASITSVETRDELVGKIDYDVFDKELADKYFKLERKVFDGELDVAQEIQPTLDKDGNKASVDNRKYPIKDEQGNIIGLFGVARVFLDK
ncbi:MAG: hypothetical protein DRG78_20050 [Epsilonproteobacteria bacterium]|nr:MAG: hypothetical protein DRG78_20050 [Campylobacterota bacterium]